MIRSVAVCSLLVAGTLTAFAAPTSPATGQSTTQTTTQATLPSTQAVIDHYIAATGGAAAHASINSRRATGIYTMPDLGVEGTLEWIARRDGAALLTIDLPGIGVFRQGITPAGVVWSVDPGDGAHLLRGDDAAGVRRSLALEADLSLAGYTNATVGGVVALNGRPAYRLDLVDPAGMPEQRYFDVETGLLVRSVAITPPSSTTRPASRPTAAATAPSLDIGSISVTTFFGDYGDVPPVRIPMRIRQAAIGLSPEIVLKHVELNIDLPDARFDPPPEVQALRRRPTTRK